VTTPGSSTWANDYRHYVALRNALDKKPHDALAAYLEDVELLLGSLPGIDEILAEALTGIGVR
jgi:hypothetical protein